MGARRILGDASYALMYIDMDLNIYNTPVLSIYQFSLELNKMEELMGEKN